MSRRRAHGEARADWPRTLHRVLEAAEAECPRGHAGALRQLTGLAFHKVVSRGLFDPAIRGEDDLFAAIEAAATTHLDLAAARVIWRQALDQCELTLDQRNTVEEAALQVQSVSDTAYFYAGLAFGLAFVYVHGTT